MNPRTPTPERSHPSSYPPAQSYSRTTKRLTASQTEVNCTFSPVLQAVAIPVCQLKEAIRPAIRQMHLGDASYAQSSLRLIH